MAALVSGWPSPLCCSAGRFAPSLATPAGVQHADPRGTVSYEEQSGSVTAAPARRDAGGGISTGLDLFTEEEVAKRRARADRFQVAPNPALQYLPDEEDEVRRKRAERFAITVTPAASLSRHPRTDVGREEERRGDAIHVHGVDALSTSQVLALFGDYGPTRVEWLSASSANIIFSDPHSTKRAMVARGQPLLPAQQQQQPQQQPGVAPMEQDMEASEAAAAAPPSQPQPRVTYRMATVSDLPDPAQPVRQRGPKWRPPRAPRAVAAGAAGNASGGGSSKGKRGREDADGDVEMGDNHGDNIFAEDSDNPDPDEAANGDDVEMGAGAGGVEKVDGDGDVEMKRTRGERGGRRNKARKVDGAQGPGRFLIPEISIPNIPVVSFPVPKLDYTDLEDEEVPPPSTATPARVTAATAAAAAGGGGYSRGSGGGANAPRSRAAGPAPPRPPPINSTDLRVILQRHRLRTKNAAERAGPSHVSAPGVDFGRRALAMAGLVKGGPLHERH
ncbi:MAG: hypothetical protein WDW36_004529 [Sanguina aurantia]